MKMKPSKTVLLMILAACLSAGVSFSSLAAQQTLSEPSAKPVPIIFDTDLDTDCDDAGALAMLHTFADQGEIRILATIVSSRFAWSAPCLEVINRYRARPDLPIGAPKGEGADVNRGSRYARQMAEEFSPLLKTNDDAQDAVDVYRSVLAAAPDSSVTIVTVSRTERTNGVPLRTKTMCSSK
jgi:hypothetical protein